MSPGPFPPRGAADRRASLPWATTPLIVGLLVFLLLPGIPGLTPRTFAPGAPLPVDHPTARVGSVVGPTGLVGGFYAHPGGPAPPAHRLPSYCSVQAPAETLPLNPVERARVLECANLGNRPAAAPAAGAFDPTGFGLYNVLTTYDSTDGYVLLLGATGTGPLNGTQTWGFSAGTWTELGPITSPESCMGSALAYDDVDGYVVYLGGANIGSGANCSSAGQTWTFHGGQWYWIHPTTSPAARQAAALTNDSRDGYLLLFGGLSASCGVVCNDTWAFSGGQWTQMFPAVAPVNRSGAGMTYDALDGYVVMFGGTTSTSCLPFHNSFCMLRDTWAYAGGVWTQLSPVGAVPPEPYDDGLVYDAHDGYALYTVTDDNRSSDPELYWNFSGGNWTDLTMTPSYAHAPANRLGEALAYDWKDGYAVMYGGYRAGYTWQVLNDTWTFQSNVWSDRTVALNWSASLVISPPAVDLGRSIQISTSISGPADTYHFQYSGLPTGCSTQDQASFACVPTATISTWVTVTVTNGSGVWVSVLAHVAVVPGVSVQSFSASPGSVVQYANLTLFVSTTGGVLPLSYRYSGLPQGCYSVDAPSFSCVPTSIGAYQLLVNVSDASGVFSLASARVNVTAAGAPPPPTISRFQVVPAAVFLGGAVVFSVIASGGAYPLSYHYYGLPSGCLTSNGSAIACVPSVTGTFNVTVVVTDALAQTSSAVVTLTVASLGTGPTGPALAISAFFASPAALALGGATVLEVFASGGSPPYVYSFTSLPDGCTSTTTTSAAFSCTPTITGTFSARVLVTDSGANPGPNSTFATTLLVVTAAPALVAPGQSSVGPTWTEFILGILSVSLAVVLVMVVFSRRPGSP